MKPLIWPGTLHLRGEPRPAPPQAVRRLTELEMERIAREAIRARELRRAHRIEGA